MSKNVFWTNCALLCCCLGLLYTPTASADFISGGNTILSSDGSEIGGGAGATVEWAWNCNGTCNATVQGITFHTDQPSGIALEDYGYAKSSTATSTLYDTAMQPMMQRMYATNPNAQPNVVTLSGLTVNQLYTVQFLHHQVKTDDPPVREGNVLFGGDSSGTALGDVFNAGDATGHITTATFMADAVTQEFYFLPLNPTSAGGADRVPLSGAVLFAVPEPSTVTLLLACLLSLLLPSWWKRK